MVSFELRFLYDRAALLLYSKSGRYLVVGDLHIGLERKLSDKGIHIYGNAERMGNEIVNLAKENRAKSIILLGDIKESILYPEAKEKIEISEFFNILQEFNVRIAVGNHDGHLSEITKVPIENEITVGNVAMLHGHMWPSDSAMKKDYIIVAHNHVAVSMIDEKNALYNQKAWMMAEIGDKARGRYKEFNKKIKLIVMPAFNDLIIGTPVNKDEKHINPLFRNRVFDYNNANVYTMSGSIVGTPKTLTKS